MLYYDRIELSERIDLTKSNNSKECMVCHYSYFFRLFEFKNIVCNGCHDLTILCPTLRDFAIITVKGVGYQFVIHDFSKSKAIHLLENPVLKDQVRNKSIIHVIFTA